MLERGTKTFVFHPKAFLNAKRNVKRGLISRTKILKILDNKKTIASNIAKECGLTYNVVLHHLKLLEAEAIVSRKTLKKPFVWDLTGIGQQRLKTG